MLQSWLRPRVFVLGGAFPWREMGDPEAPRFSLAWLAKRPRLELTTPALGSTEGTVGGALPAPHAPSPHPAWHLGQWPLLGQGTVLVQPLPGRPLPELHRLLPRGTAPRGQLPPAEDHREGQLCQSQAGPAHPHGPGGERGDGCTSGVEGWGGRSFSAPAVWVVGCRGGLGIR